MGPENEAGKRMLRSSRVPILAHNGLVTRGRLPFTNGQQLAQGVHHPLPACEGMPERGTPGKRWGCFLGADYVGPLEGTVGKDVSLQSL